MAVAIPPTGWNYEYPNPDGTYTRIVGNTLTDLYTAVAQYELGASNCTTTDCFIAYQAKVNALLPTIIPAVNAYLATLQQSVQACYQAEKPCVNFGAIYQNTLP